MAADLKLSAPIILKPATQVPMAEPRLEKKKTSKMRVAGLRNQPLTVVMSKRRFSRSDTRGFLTRILPGR